MATEQQNTSYLIARLAKIADDPTNHVDGVSRIKAAVMVAYLSGRPAPAGGRALTGFLDLQREFGIQLAGPTTE